MNNNIGVACNITTGKLDANQAVVGGSYPFFTCAEFPDQIDSYAFDDDVVLIAGNNAKGNFHVSRYKGKFNAYQRTYVLTAKDGFDIDYVYYALKLELKRLRERSQGSQTKFLTKPILTDIRLGDVSNHEQFTVANVLKSIDKKIELNNRINAELEAMAKTLYDYWFVQFDFPDANGKPYKASGGKMVYNETLKREIPEGWDNGTLDELGQIVGGSTPSTSQPENFSDEGTPWITPNDLSENQGNKFISRGSTNVSDSGIKSASLKKYPAGTVLLSSRAPIGYMAIARNDVTTNQGFKSFVPSKGYSSEFVYYAVKNSLKAIIQYSSGSTFKEVSGTVLKTVKTVLPEASVVEDYTKKVETIFSRQDKLEQENLQLSELRDWLLPMLMNGQVTVKP
ncbi:restriction endonuclease subunit S [Vibrio parahaemolyticus]|nr:restriction endonuclease subunit S [Vibrio parahaemolyticus]